MGDFEYLYHIKSPVVRQRATGVVAFGLSLREDLLPRRQCQKCRKVM